MVKSIAALLSGQAAYRGAVAAYSIALVAVLTRAEYGDFALAVATIAIAVAVADGGLTRLLTRDVARAQSGRGGLVGTLLAVRFRWGAVVLLVLGFLVAGPLAPSDDRNLYLAVVVIATGLEATATGFEAASLGAEMASRVAVGQVLAAIALLVMLALVLVASASVVLAVVGLAAASATRAAWNALLWRPAVRDREDPIEALSILREALPFLFIALLGAVYYRIDVVILHTLKGAAATAPYAAAYRVLDGAIVLGGTVANGLIPRLSRAWPDPSADVWSMWCRYAAITLVFTVPAAVLIALSAHDLAGLLFGARYREDAGRILQILAPGVIFATAHGVNAAVVLSSDRQGSLVLLSLVHVGFNVVLTAVLADAHGANGAAIASTISATFTFVYFAAIVRRWSRQPPPAG